MGRHRADKVMVEKQGDVFVLVLSGTGERVAGYPAYELRWQAQSQANKLNNN